MTNEELTEKYIDLQTKLVKIETEKQVAFDKIANIEQDVKDTKRIVEDVHIMATNMKTMQETQEAMSKDIEELKNKEFNQYKESKKIVKDKIISGIGGAIASAFLGFLIWTIKTFAK